MRPIVTKFVALLTVLVLVESVGVEAQPLVKRPSIGYLALAAGPSPVTAAFDQALRERGWIKDQNIRIEYRWAAGRPEALPSLAAELVSLEVDVLVAGPLAPALAAKRATAKIPVVFLGGGDPIANGLVPNHCCPN